MMGEPIPDPATVPPPPPSGYPSAAEPPPIASVQIACPSCGAPLFVAEEDLGRRALCPKCGTEFATAAQPDAWQGCDTSTDVPDEIPRRSGAKVALLLTAGLLVVGVFVGIIVAVSGSGHERNKPVAQKGRERWPGREEAVEPPPFSESDNAAAVAVGIGLVWLIMLGVMIAYVVLVVLLMAWVARDARARGMDGAPVWILVIFLSGIIGLLIYMASRPYGILVVCPRCGNKRLQAALKCPHCGVAEAG
jgi:hypothetical protein